MPRDADHTHCRAKLIGIMRRALQCTAQDLDLGEASGSAIVSAIPVIAPGFPEEIHECPHGTRHAEYTTSGTHHRNA